MHLTHFVLKAFERVADLFTSTCIACSSEFSSLRAFEAISIPLLKHSSLRPYPSACGISLQGWLHCRDIILVSSFKPPKKPSVHTDPFYWQLRFGLHGPKVPVSPQNRWILVIFPHIFCQTLSNVQQHIYICPFKKFNVDIYFQMRSCDKVLRCGSYCQTQSRVL